ncbi:hypothetical protein E4582_08430 [Luteimonas yindakuii]|uniref:Glycosyltransferase RgtA/B/C/D-like domain-containing protein n=1 Tax=Luteimonas yindakuii TaxID=2565782 RepID=A0A4Z1RF54_9GAMM|nr:hypothetical protein [Luteimonas yindakuii]TKS54783.1 hypothetical protein E4582_08430 [Luteimonas yindakuii]
MIGLSGQVIMDDIVLTPLQGPPLSDWQAQLAFIQQTGARQISFASFVIQAKWLGADPLVSQAVNVLLHLLNGALAYRVFLRIGERNSPGSTQVFACIAGLIWILNPAHATTVLYSIQRMTLLAATGSFVIFYLALGTLSRRSIAFIAVVYPLAILAKENAILALPAALILRMMTAHSDQTRRRAYTSLSAATAVVLIVSLWAAPLLEIPLRYAAWDFTLPERLVLAPDILAQHFRMFLLPMPSSFSFYYDDYFIPGIDTLSLLKFFQLSALPILLMALYPLSNRFPIVAAGIALFFALHSVEGSVLALDLFFEHRNYIPSIGLAAAAGALLTGLARAHHRAPLTTAMIVAMYLVTCLGYRTYVIGDEMRLAIHHVDRHPASFRAAADAAYYAEGLRAAPTRNTPFQIEVEAINLVRTCSATPSPVPLNSFGSAAVPKRSLRLHETALVACASDPCAVSPAYIHRLSSTYLIESRVDSYRHRIEPLLAHFLRAHVTMECGVRANSRTPAQLAD